MVTPHLKNREGQEVRIQKEIRQARSTHKLLSAEGGTIRAPKNNERAGTQGALTSYRAQQIRTSKVNGRAKDTHTLLSRGRDNLGNWKKPSEWVTLTFYRAQREKQLRTPKSNWGREDSRPVERGGKVGSGHRINQASKGHSQTIIEHSGKSK